MKIVTKKLDKGIVVIVAEDIDDLWHLYNIVYPGDRVAARTVRRVRRASEEGARPDKGERKRMFIRLEVDEVSLHKYSNRLRIKGRILEGPEDLVSIGSFHTINVESGTKLEIVKDHWSRQQLRRLDEAASRKSQRIVVISIEENEAAIGVIDDTGVEVIVEFHGSARGKYGKYVQTAETMNRMFSDIALQLNEVLERISDITRVLIVGPGSTKERFAAFLKNRTPSIHDKLMLENVSSGTVAGLYEALHRGVIERIASDIRLNKEIQLMNELLRHLGKDTGKAAYGWDEISRAVQFGAVESLLVLDKLLREIDSEKRRELENLMRQVEKQAGSVDIFSSDHQAGKQLGGLGGIAGILRFPLPTS